MIAVFIKEVSMIIFKINCIIECFILYLSRLHCFTFSVKNLILSAKVVAIIDNDSIMQAII